MNIKLHKISYSNPIRKLRAKLGISQEKLAEKLGTSFSSVNRWENGHHEPTIIAMEKLKELFEKYDIELKNE